MKILLSYLRQTMAVYQLRKLIDNFEKGRHELYDLEKDISESNDISETNPSETRELFTLLNDWRKNSKAKMMDPNPDWNQIRVTNQFSND
jgi:hypothetical protein